MTINPLDIFILLGALQGLILAVLLWTTPKGPRLANRLLATLMLLLASACFSVGVPVAHIWISWMLDVVPLIFAMPVGPLIYFYTQSLLTPAFRLGRWQRLQFAPALFDVAKQGIVWAYLLGSWAGFISGPEGEWWGHLRDGYVRYVDVLTWLSLTGYLVLTQRYLQAHRRAADAPAPPEQAHLRWLTLLLRVWVGFQGLWLLYLVAYFTPALHHPSMDGVGYYPLYLPLAALIYWLGLRGYLHAQRSFDAAAPKPRAAPLAADLAEQHLARLRQAMQADALYLDAELTVEKVSQHLQLPAKTISATLNQHLGQSFNAFVNAYRVEAVQQKLREPAARASTIQGIAFDCGFNSPATFQRAFRRATGLSPTEYLEKAPETS
ncbi:MAG TPA: AraC family transcriptional regulator [Roseiflexaceae bacterium]|nr:AraC family transcriptional regulator [Roseiflexaceae bacterium]